MADILAQGKPNSPKKLSIELKKKTPIGNKKITRIFANNWESIKKIFYKMVLDNINYLIA